MMRQEKNKKFIYNEIRKEISMQSISAYWQKAPLIVVYDYKLKFLSELLMFCSHIQEDRINLLTILLKNNKLLFLYQNSDDETIILSFEIFHDFLIKKFKDNRQTYSQLICLWFNFVGETYQLTDFQKLILEDHINFTYNEKQFEETTERIKSITKFIFEKSRR